MNDITEAAATGLMQLDARALERIEQGMVEQRRVAHIFGRQSSQTTLKLQTLNMLAAGPMRQLRQIAAEIEKRNLALREQGIRLQRLAVEKAQCLDVAVGSIDTIYRNDSNDRALARLDAENKQLAIDSTRAYVDGALKDIAALLDAYEQIRSAHGIREAWDEEDFEREEIRHHVRSIFRLAFRDYLRIGTIDAGTAEYAESFGIHPFTVQQETTIYAMELMRAAAPPAMPLPKGEQFQKWLDDRYEAHSEDWRAMAARMGVVEFITRWALYVEPPAPPA